MQTHVAEYRKWHDCDLRSAVGEFGSPPPRFTSLLLRQLGSPFYSISALTLGFLTPSLKTQKVIGEKHPNIEKELVLSLAIIWLQTFVGRFAFDAAVKEGRGAFALHGRMIDAPVADQARATLARAAR